MPGPARPGANPGGGRAGKPGGAVMGELSKRFVELSKRSVELSKRPGELSLLVRPAAGERSLGTWVLSGLAVRWTASSGKLKSPCWHVLACMIEI